MSVSDRERWERKYAAGNPNPSFTPDPILTQHVALLTGDGLALDVACGVGQNALYLAKQGYEVIAVDGSLTALRHCRAQLRRRPLPVHLVAADLDQFKLPAAHFALILVVRFLDRALIPRLKNALVPGGLLIYETFNIHWLQAKPSFNPAFLLEPGELAAQFADFELIATNDNPQMHDALSHFVGRRPRV
ncbi:MAG: class I SAM-dependent methyltransferase [Pseudomonadota bacterium]|nr:MAG: class I SAM-dependent methyltransferase [Pseudomonadota bacterium]